MSQAAGVRWRVVGLVGIALTLCSVSSCGHESSNTASSSPLSAAQVRQLDQYQETILVNTKASKVLAEGGASTSPMRSVIEEYERTKDPALGKRIVKAMPEAAIIDPLTGRWRCCDRGVLRRAIRPSTYRDEAGERQVDKALEDVAKLLKGHSSDEPIGDDGETVRSYLVALYRGLRDAESLDLAARVADIAQDAGIRRSDLS